LLVASAATSFAADPSVTFDFSRTAECRDITSTAAEDAFPGEKIVALHLRVSVHLLRGQPADVEEVHIEINDCDGRMRVHSFEPTTRLESQLSQDIRWSKTTQQNKAVQASLGGELPVVLGDVVAHVTPTINGGLEKRETVSETQYRIAPKHVVVASGTIGQVHGVFFKLRASPQTSLEGVHELTIQFVVPEKWRADTVRVCCQATGQKKFLWMKQQTTWNHTCAPVAIYLAGDSKARQAAERFAATGDRS